MRTALGDVVAAVLIGFCVVATAVVAHLLVRFVFYMKTCITHGLVVLDRMRIHRRSVIRADIRQWRHGIH